jgi:hypothetical protein
VPKSKSRKKAVYTPPPKAKEVKVSPRWLAPLMVTCWILGVAWISTWYVWTDAPLLGTLREWNLAIGFGFIILGVILSTRWR